MGPLKTVLFYKIRCFRVLLFAKKESEVLGKSRLGNRYKIELVGNTLNVVPKYRKVRLIVPFLFWLPSYLRGVVLRYCFEIVYKTKNISYSREISHVSFQRIHF